MSELIETELNTMDIKSRFNKEMWYVYLEMLGLDRRDALQRKAYTLVKRIMRKEMKVCVAFLVAPTYHKKLRRILKESYNYYRDNNDPKLTDKQFDEHFTFCELLIRNGIPYSLAGVKVVDYNEIVEKKMKFDLIIGNPPYQIGKETRVDLKIHRVLQGNLKDDGKMVFVHPAGFFLSHKYGVNPKNPIDTKKLESIHMFWGNSIFNIGSFTPLCVTVWDNAKKEDGVVVTDDAYTYSTYECAGDKIHIYGAKNYTAFCKWLNANVNYSTALSSKAISAKNVGVVTLPYAFELSTLRGNPAHGDDIKFKDDFFTIIPKEADKIVPHYLKAGDAVTYNNVFEFKTADERTNFMNYLKTKAVRFILSLSKVDKNLLYGELNQIPWMDFTRSYSDKELCKMWNIDEKLWKFIDSHIPNYYPDYHFDGFYQDK